MTEKKETVLEGRAFLKEITEKLRQKITQMDREILAGQKDIESMHEYYWDNYTEMDQYGYEDYDNQQALLQRVNANQDSLRLKARYVKMLDSPFFGRVDFRYEGDDEPELFYIGIGNFAEEAGKVPLIYDWRAPVSGLFYDYDKGPAFYEAPAGRMDGEIEAKWQYKIRRGKMVYGFESDVKIDDEILMQELGSNSDVQLKNIVRTIQKEQNAIIRNTSDRILVIQGAAGSGKTSVALHRIAYLLYHDRKHLKSSSVLVLSPNSVFSDYISHILPELGEENIREMSLDLFAYRELKKTAPDCEDRYHLIEHRLAGMEEEEWKRYRWKQSSECVGAMEGFLAQLEEWLVNLKGVHFRGVEKTEEEMIRLFYFKFQDVPVLARMEAVMEYFVDEYETLYNKELSEEEIEKLRTRFHSMYTTTDVYKIYNWFLEEQGLPKLPDVPYDRRYLSYEDVYPMLYLKYRLLGADRQEQIRHLVVDEMQDYSYLQYTILGLLFQCPMTILGDRAQTMEEEQNDVTKFLPKILGKQLKMIEMNKSYRNTVEIARYAGTLGGIEETELLDRHGKPVEEETFSQEEERVSRILDKVKTGPDDYETAAVLTMTEEEAKTIYQMIREKTDQVHYIDRDSSRFGRGLTVTTFYMAKGLEFDQVFTAASGEQNGLTKQAEYICATRALHELYIYRI
nr:UvrD-helicase domain-containing protein [uncultured Sellimonas sp.]